MILLFERYIQELSKGWQIHLTQYFESHALYSIIASKPCSHKDIWNIARDTPNFYTIEVISESGYYV